MRQPRFGSIVSACNAGVGVPYLAPNPPLCAGGNHALDTLTDLRPARHCVRRRQRSTSRAVGRGRGGDQEDRAKLGSGDAILTALPQYGKPTAFTLESPEIDGRGDLAYAWERFSYTSSKLVITGRGLVIFRKQPDGSWLADRVIWNSDQPLPK